MVKHKGTIAPAVMAVLVLTLAVAVLTSPRHSPTSTTDQDQTTLTPHQQERVNERLDQCFRTGDC